MPTRYSLNFRLNLPYAVLVSMRGEPDRTRRHEAELNLNAEFAKRVGLPPPDHGWTYLHFEPASRISPIIDALHDAIASSECTLQDFHAILDLEDEAAPYFLLRPRHQLTNYVQKNGTHPILKSHIFNGPIAVSPALADFLHASPLTGYTLLAPTPPSHPATYLALLPTSTLGHGHDHPAYDPSRHKPLRPERLIPRTAQHAIRPLTFSPTYFPPNSLDARILALIKPQTGLNLPHCFLRSRLPATDFAYAPSQRGTYDVYLSQRARNLLLSAGYLHPSETPAIHVSDTLPPNVPDLDVELPPPSPPPIPESFGIPPDGTGSIEDAIHTASMLKTDESRFTPATPESLSRIESILGHQIPRDLHRVLDQLGLHFFTESFELLWDPEYLARDISIYRPLTLAILPDLDPSRCLPLASCGNGDWYSIILTPDYTSISQIILFDHEINAPTDTWPSLATLLHYLLGQQEN